MRLDTLIRRGEHEETFGADFIGRLAAEVEESRHAIRTTETGSSGSQTIRLPAERPEEIQKVPEPTWLVTVKMHFALDKQAIV